MILWRKTLRFIALGLIYALSRFDVQGIENIPKKGACIMVTNHLGFVDGALGYVIPPRYDVSGFVADIHKQNRFLNWLIPSAGAIWVRRGEPDRQALRAALDHLHKGGLFGIAPEGTRSRTGGLQRAHTGAAYLADKSGVALVPVAFWGSEGAVHKMFTFKHPAIYVRVGKPFRLPPVDPHERTAMLERNTDELMIHIARLLPARYRGFYADHPRLKELIEK
jgi:1-acyl-sn-glycerol-3-phosphate acyltransferase